MPIADSLATIVGLIGMFRAERKAGVDDDYQEFLAWLQMHRHDELIRYIVENGAIGMAIDTMLKDQHGQVMAELAELNRITTGLAHNLSSLSGLASAIDAAAPQLSEQSLSILTQFNESGASSAIELKSNNGTEFRFYDRSGKLVITEPRFLDDDLAQLVALGLLLRDYNSQGSIVLKLTRAGAALGQQPAPADD